MPDSEVIAFLTLREAYDWARKREAPETFLDILYTLHMLCRRGLVRAEGCRSTAPQHRQQIEQWKDAFFDSDGEILRSDSLFIDTDDAPAWTDVRLARNDLIEHWPEEGAVRSLEAEAERGWADRERRSMQRRVQQQRCQAAIDKFYKKQQKVRRWFSFVDISDACARLTSPASIEAEEEARSLAYRQLVDSMCKGEFERAGRSSTWLLVPALPSARSRVTYDYLKTVLKVHGMNDFSSASHIVRRFLCYIWLPREMCREWFERHNREWPDWFNPPRRRLRADLQRSGAEAPVNIEPIPRHPKGHPGRKPGSGSFDDEPALQAMHGFLKTNEATSISAAARLALDGGIAKQTGTYDSAVTRLRQKYIKKFGPNLPPKSKLNDAAESQPN